jgi:hypothetical protein
MISDNKKKQIESLSTDEMLFEINLDRKSRFQREKFVYLKTCYQLRLSKENKKISGEQSVATNKTSNKSSEKTPPFENISGLKKFAYSVGVIVFAAIVIWVINHYLSLCL